MVTNDNPYTPPISIQSSAPVFGDPQTAKRRLILAGALTISGGIEICLFATTLIHRNLDMLKMFPNLPEREGTTRAYAAGIWFLILLAGLCCVYGGAQMIRLRRYRLNVATAVLSVAVSTLLSIILRPPILVLGIPSVVLILNIPIGIWALMILLRKSTRAAFAEAN